MKSHQLYKNREKLVQQGKANHQPVYLQLEKVKIHRRLPVLPDNQNRPVQIEKEVQVL
jgi:hypothetical protein